MYGVIIEKGPQNWQILQQEAGYATVTLAGSVQVEAEVLAAEDGAVVIRVVDENTGARMAAPVFVAPRGTQWQALLTIPAGGLYRIETYYRYNKICEKRGDRIFHIGVGDVYVIAGQSNAVGVGKDSVNDPVSDQVHMFRLSGQWDIASHPLHDSTDTRYPLSQEKAQTGHSPWLNFAKLLNRHLGYPIGLIPATKGGIPLSCWDRKEDGAFFENMLAIVGDAGGKVKGVLWSQGCNDSGEEPLRRTYLERFRRVCEDFRQSLGEDIPILTVQLNKVTCTKDKDLEALGRDWAELREAQRRAMHEIPGVYMAPSIDQMVCDGIHNGAMSNLVIGERVANLALHYIYGKSVICDAPDIRAAVREDNCNIRLHFNHVQDHLFADLNRTEALMFSVTDETGRMEPVDYRCDGDDSILLIFEREISGKAAVSCDGYNETGLMPYDVFSYLPVIPFCDVPVVMQDVYMPGADKTCAEEEGEQEGKMTHGELSSIDEERDRSDRLYKEPQRR